MVAKVHSFLRKDNKAAASDSRSRSSTVGSGQWIEVVWDMRQARSIYIFTRIRELHSVALFCVCSWVLLKWFRPQLQAKWCKGRRVEWNPRSGRQVRHLPVIHLSSLSSHRSINTYLSAQCFGGKLASFWRETATTTIASTTTYDDDDDHSIIPYANASSTINIKPCGVYHSTKGKLATTPQPRWTTTDQNYLNDNTEKLLLSFSQSPSSADQLQVASCRKRFI